MCYLHLSHFDSFKAKGRLRSTQTLFYQPVRPDLKSVENTFYIFVYIRTDVLIQQKQPAKMCPDLRI